MLTRREAAIISAYTGVMLGSFSDMQEYVEKVLDRPTQTIEYASKEFFAELRQKVKPDFMALEVEG